METTTKTKGEWLAELARLFPAEIVGFKRPEDGVPTDLEFGTYLPPLIAKDGVKCDQMNAYLRQLLSSDKDLMDIVTAIQDQLANCDLRVVTETLKGLATPEMLKKLNGIQAGALNNPHPATHPATMINQDASHRFVTDTEKNTWNNKADAEHGQHTPAKETANNSRFLRNDATWQAVTPGNIGAYTKAEVDNTVNALNSAIGGKAPTNHPHTGAQIDAPRGDQNKDLNTAREIRWRNFGDGHTIVDMSGGHYPGGNQNAQVAWQPTYPTLAGYNGSQTFGLRVDSARVADSAGSAPANGGNADTVDGLHINGGRNTEGNKLVRTNGSGYIDVGYINSNNGVENGNITNLIYDNGDGYYRKCSLAHLINSITAGGGGGIVGSSLAANGWVKFANGLILQWGTKTSISSSQGGAQVSVAMSISFSIACFAAFTTLGGALNTDAVANVYTKSKSSITVGIDAVYGGGMGNLCFDWCAIGV